MEDDELSEEIKRMIDLEANITSVAGQLGAMYRGLVESGMPEDVATKVLIAWVQSAAAKVE